MPAVPHAPTSFLGGNPNAPTLLTTYPTELILNQKLNLNRPFGDGLDLALPTKHPLEINGTLVTDDALEIELLQMSNPTTYANWLNDVVLANERYPLRQAYARHLYCTMMYLLGTTSVDLNYDGLPDNQAQKARAVAQWAINVVDFRDSDSIMTPFAYDPDLSDGWNTPLNPYNELNPSLADPMWNQYVVWGCERPELLLTEALATHDRRTEDLDTEDQNPSNPADVPNLTTAAMDPDADFDQRLRPMGSLLIELYNPWLSTYSAISNASDPSHSETPPADLYGPAGGPATALAGVMLNAVSQNTGGGSSPVWRILVAKDESRFADPDHKQDQFPPPPGFGGGPSSFNDNDVERVIYFASHDPAPGPGQVDLRNIMDFPASTLRDVMAPTPEEAVLTDVIAPGRYAVIGPGYEANSIFLRSDSRHSNGLHFCTFGCRPLNPNNSGMPFGDGPQGLRAARHVVLGVGTKTGRDLNTLDDAVVVNNVQVPNYLNGIQVSLVSVSVVRCAAPHGRLGDARAPHVEHFRTDRRLSGSVERLASDGCQWGG